MACLGEQIWTRPHRMVEYYVPGRGLKKFIDLDESHAYTVKLKQLGEGRVEGVVQRTNLQRIMDLSDPDLRPRGHRFRPMERDEDNIARARLRARQAVRSMCMRINADRMLTMTTRKTILFDVLLARFQRFVRAYQRHAKGKFLYVAVPELHADGEHFHIHIATSGFFDLKVANSIWYALCAFDDPDHSINGNIDVKRFTQRRAHEDTPSIIAGYIAKYVGKCLGQDFNRRSYWASRIGAQEIQHRILKAKSPEQAVNELSELLGINWTSIILTHAGCFFPLPNDRGFWFKVTPEMQRLEIPF